MDNTVKFEYFKSTKGESSISPNQKIMKRYARDLINIADLYNIKLDSDTSKSGKGLKILTNKCLIVYLYYSLK